MKWFYLSVQEKIFFKFLNKSEDLKFDILLLRISRMIAASPELCVISALFSFSLANLLFLVIFLAILLIYQYMLGCNYEKELSICRNNQAGGRWVRVPVS